MDVGLDEVKVELDVVQQLDMLTQLTSSKVHNEGSPNISPRSTAARVLVSIMPEPRGLQHGAWARRSSVPPTTFDDQVLVPPPLRKSRTAPYPQRSVAAGPRKPSQTPEPLRRGTMPLAATGSAIMHEVLDHGGIAASTFDLNLRGRMLREKLIPADEILRPRKPENDEQRGSPLWMTSRRCEPLQEQPSTDLLGFHMSQLAAGCEHFRERFLFESNTPVSAELSTQMSAELSTQLAAELTAELMARSRPTNLMDSGLVDRASAERATNELHRLRHQALVANAENARLELERAELEAAELLQAELRELAEIKSRTQSRLHAQPPTDARGLAPAPAPAPAPSHAQAPSHMQNAHGGASKAQWEKLIWPEETSPRGSAPSPLESPSCSRPVNSESTTTESPMQPWSSPAWFANGMVGPFSGSGEVRAPSPGSQPLQQYGEASQSMYNGLHACQSQVMSCHITSPISSPILVSTQALHAVPGTLVNGTLMNGTLVQPNFVAQVVPSGAWPMAAPRRRPPMVQQSQIASQGGSPLPLPSAVNPSTWQGMGTASAHPMTTQPSFTASAHPMTTQPNYLPNTQPFHTPGSFGQPSQLLHATAACQGPFVQSKQPMHASAAPAPCAPIPSFLMAKPCMSGACTSATNTGPCHKQMPAPPPTILSAGRTSCSPIGALTKPLHKEEVIASFLPTAM